MLNVCYTTMQYLYIAYMETNPSYQQVMMTKNGDVLEDDMQALSQDGNLNVL